MYYNSFEEKLPHFISNDYYVGKTSMVKVLQHMLLITMDVFKRSQNSYTMVEEFETDCSVCSYQYSYQEN